MAWFAVIGGIGFCTEATALHLLVSRDVLGPVESRVISFPLAVTLTWLLNRRFTFPGGSRWPTAGAYTLYVLGQTFGAIFNFTVYAALVGSVAFLAKRPVVALAVAAVVALAFNFVWARRLVFSSSHVSPGGMRP